MELSESLSKVFKYLGSRLEIQELELEEVGSDLVMLLTFTEGETIQYTARERRRQELDHLEVQLLLVYSILQMIRIK